MAAVGFVLPRITYHGLETLEKLKELTGEKAVIVTGGGSMMKSGVIKKAQDFLKESGISNKTLQPTRQGNARLMVKR